MRSTLFAVTLGLAALGTAPAQAANIPCETARLIVPWKAGGGTHVLFSDGPIIVLDTRNMELVQCSKIGLAECLARAGELDKSTLLLDEIKASAGTSDLDRNWIERIHIVESVVLEKQMAFSSTVDRMD